MSNRLITVRDALQRTVDAIARAHEHKHLLPPSVWAGLVSAHADLLSALAATAFVLPPAFPADALTRGGCRVTLVARYGDELIGLHHDEDGTTASTWNLDGSYFGGDDPDESDLVLPVDAAAADVRP